MKIVNPQLSCVHSFAPSGMGVTCEFCEFAPTREQIACYLNTGSFAPPNNSLHLTASRGQAAKKAKPRRARGK